MKWRYVLVATLIAVVFLSACTAKRAPDEGVKIDEVPLDKGVPPKDPVREPDKEPGKDPGKSPPPPGRGPVPQCKFPGPFTDQGTLKQTSGERLPQYETDPFVLWNAKKQQFEMWISDFLPDPSRGGLRGWTGFPFATSKDGMAWSYYKAGTNERVHVLDPTLGKWDNNGIETNTVLLKDGIYHMWYLGYPGVDLKTGQSLLGQLKGRIFSLGYATSPDGITWKKHPDNPIFRPSLWWELPQLETRIEGGRTVTTWSGGINEPAAIWDEEQQIFKLWYEAKGVINKNTMTGRRWRIGYAESKDGVTWVKEQNPVFVAQPGTWEQNGGDVGHTNVIEDPQKGCHLFYLAGGSKGTIGHAYSENCKDNWERNQNNPILPHIPREFNGGPSAVYKPDEEKIYLFYMRWEIPPEGSTVIGLYNTHIRLATADCKIKR